MFILIPSFAMLSALILLIALSWIDLKEGILPNVLVFLFLLTGVTFHLTTPSLYLDWADIGLGLLTGGGVLLFIRTGANWLYKDDTLGLGDVKLMGAAGVWLGVHFVLLALIMGAIAGLLHGLTCAIISRVKTKNWPDMKTLSIPAGPGFALGIVMAGVMLFTDFPADVIHALNKLQ